MTWKATSAGGKQAMLGDDVMKLLILVATRVAAIYQGWRHCIGHRTGVFGVNVR
jgi:hypothetical protein